MLYAGNACIYDLSGLFGQVSGDIAINRFALRLHGPAFISADKFAYAAHVLRVVAPERCRRQDGAVLALWHFQLVSADQRTMDQKVRIAPDGRSEMAVASKRKHEKAQVAWDGTIGTASCRDKVGQIV